MMILGQKMTNRKVDTDEKYGNREEELILIPNATEPLALIGSKMRASTFQHGYAYANGEQ